MNITSLITTLVLKGKYPLIFVLLFFEGTATNFISSSISASGVLNIWIIWISAIILELCADILYYSIGTRIDEERILKRIKGDEDDRFFDILRKSCKSKPSLSLLIIKFLGPLAIPSIMYFGNQRILSLPRFVLTGSLVAISRASVLSFTGYMVGKGLSGFESVYDIVRYIGVVVILFVVLYLVSKMYPKWYMKIFEKIK